MIQIAWKKFTIVVLVTIVAEPVLAERIKAVPPPDPIHKFSTAKKKARNFVYEGHQFTLYCGCKFVHTRTASGGKISNLDCGYEPRKNVKRGKRLEWEHIMPASFFGHSRSCWKGDELCRKTSGKKYKGRKCCAKVDDEFERMEADLHNLAPAVGEVNGDRSNFVYGMVEGEPRAYGKCDFEIDRNAKVAEPAEDIRGNVARVWLYMSEAYDINIKKYRELLESWSESDPPDEWERTRNERIRDIQGNDNPFVIQ